MLAAFYQQEQQLLLLILCSSNAAHLMQQRCSSSEPLWRNIQAAAWLSRQQFIWEMRSLFRLWSMD
jgi:hypothetical protein